MAKKKVIINRWSYSRWSCYHDCPSMYEWRYILKKDKFVASPAMERGTMIHAKAENFVNGKIKGMPDELTNFKKEFMSLRREYKKGNGLTEPDISMNLDHSPSSKFESDWFVGFADFDHYVKGSEERTVIDYKTGRQYPGHQDQGHAYSMALLAMNPHIDLINVEFWYLDDKDEDTNVKHFNYNQKELPRMEKVWIKRIDRMYSDTKFKKTPFRWCSSCSRNKKNGGDCSA